MISEMNNIISHGALILSAMFLCGTTVAAEPAGNLHLLAIALNQSPDKKSGQTIDSWNYCADEMEKILSAQAKPFYREVKVQTRLGVKATRAGILEGLAWLNTSSTKDDLAVLYIGCHGGVDAKQGWGIDDAEKKKIWGSEIKAELAKLPCPALVVISACTSGGFTDGTMPPNVAAFCACSGKQQTNNQIDMSVTEGLCGRADIDKDGAVTLDELVRYVQLRYKEWWPDPKAIMNGIQTPAIAKGVAVPDKLRLTSPSPEFAAIVHHGNWYAALKQPPGADGKFPVYMLGYSNKPGFDFITSSVAREFICLPEDGAPLMVEQNGRWYPAKLLKMDGDKYHVHYIGFKEDETVAKSRVFLPFVGDTEHPNYPYFITGNAGGWARIGPPAAWKDTLAGATLNGQLYTVEKSGALYVSDLAEGTWKQIGKLDYANTKRLFAAAGALYSIETDGSLYRIDPKDGAWTLVGDAKAWKNTKTGVIHKDRLITVEPDGALYETDLATGKWKPIGKSDFANTSHLFSAGDNLYSIESDGSLYKINPADGTWSALGEPKAWKLTQAGAAINGKLYTVEKNGGLFVTDLTNGQWKQLGKAEFAGTTMMFGGTDRAYTIEKDGSLYAVSLK